MTFSTEALHILIWSEYIHTTDTYITHIHIHTYRHKHTHMYIHIYIHTHTHTYTHTNTHTHFSIVTAMHGGPVKVSLHMHFQSIHTLDSETVFTVSEHSRHISINF